MRFEILPDFTKEDLFRDIGLQQQIMERYTGCKCVEGVAYRSPFRKDGSPNCFFRFYNGKWYWCDYNANVYWDVIDVVKNQYPFSFKSILEIIQNEFGTTTGKHPPPDCCRGPSIRDREKAVIQV